MDMDDKCELASNIVDYIWYDIINKNKFVVDHHSYKHGDDMRYTDEAQDIFNKVLDIIDEVAQ